MQCGDEPRMLVISSSRNGDRKHAGKAALHLRAFLPLHTENPNMSVGWLSVWLVGIQVGADE